MLKRLALSDASVAQKLARFVVTPHTQSVGVARVGKSPSCDPPASAVGEGLRPPVTPFPVGAYDKVTGAAGLVGEAVQRRPRDRPVSPRPSTYAARHAGAITLISPSRAAISPTRQSSRRPLGPPSYEGPSAMVELQTALVSNKCTKGAAKTTKEGAPARRVKAPSVTALASRRKGATIDALSATLDRLQVFYTPAISGPLEL